ncbi:glycosyltransferase involved in cell wall biosynthesis [Dyadobacter jejuensis]|uniref:Glycosyltransferase involved in cell wall biosynthesis n=1 Tax=Dyadobacter jejuensis TaxID=1082580 RepID=A0A316AG08_9BACT|nr:glycosyltransferase family 4 protein [Dyadobacter jejuensis]PWJ56725.1 glycosyltransferase involved in cell wall biosynthesis [Dyadobacter jejuensis]
MRILIVHNQLWAHYKSKLFAEIHQSLLKRHPESTLLVAQIALYEASRKGMQNKEQQYNYDYPYRVLHPTSLDDVPFKKRLVSLFQTFHSFRPTVLNITGYFDWAQVLLMLYARLRGVKVVLSSESSVADHNRSPWKEFVKRLIVNAANACFCFGSSSAHYLRSLGVPDERIRVRHAAVIDEAIIHQKYQLAKAEVAAPSYAFVYVGRLAKEKNLELLLQAFMELKTSTPHHLWSLRIVGSGPEEDHLKNLAQGCTNIVFEGSHAWHQIPSLLAKSTVLILPSISEPWGLVVNEAMVCGMPVIVSETCGCAVDLLQEGVNGFTFRPQDREALLRHMAWFVQHPDQIATMGDASKEIILPFSSKKVAQEMVDTFRQLNRN